MHLFIGKGKSRAPSPSLDEAQAGINRQVESIDKKIITLDNDLRKFREQMSKMREGAPKAAVKAKALRILKQKKIYEEQLNSIRGQLFNIEQTGFAQGVMKSTKTTIQAMKDGMKQMKKKLKHINVEEVDDVQDELAEMVDEASNLQEALGRTYNTPEIDDDELEAELNTLGDEIALDDDSSYLDNVSSYLDDVIKTPDVPSDEPETQGKKSTHDIYVDEL